jgi:uncharacterized protein YndB with AHSA1/START domain
MTLPFLKSPEGQEPVLVEGEFAAAPARMFRAWTDPDELKSWFGRGPGSIESAQVDVRVGGTWRFDLGAGDGNRDVLFGEYLAVEPNRRLVFSWRHERTDASGRVETSAPSQVTVTFEPVDAGVRVKLVHAAIAGSDGRIGVGTGWSASFATLSERFGAMATATGEA